MSRSSLGPLVDLLHATRLRYGALRRAERASRDQLLAIQTRSLTRLLEYTAQHSPFYRQRWGGVAPRTTDFQQLDPLTRTDLVEHMDQILTDRSLTRTQLYDWLGTPGRRPYVVTATSGTTGEPVIVPFSRQAWCAGLAYVLRGGLRLYSSVLDAVLCAPRQAFILTHHPHHLSTHLGDSVAFGPFPQLRLAAGMALDDLVEQLQRFQPTMIFGYPSVLDLLAKAQLTGELSIAPRKVLTGGETLPAGFRDRVRAAWQAAVFDEYGLTETNVFAWECQEHAGLHIDEDAVILEVVDEQNRVLPSGEQETGSTS